MRHGQGGAAHPRPYSVGEEIAHSVTHGVGIVASIAGLAVLVAFASQRGDTRHVVGCSVFGASLVVLYTASTLYHGIRVPRAKPLLRIIDHSSIYLLIAGTYTPFSLVSLQGAVGWWMLSLLWGLALAGIALTATLRHRFRALAMVLYLGMGWSALFVAEPLFAALAGGGVRLVVGGGLAYTFGVLFYAWKRMPYNHLVWHLFVLAGSAMHYFAVLLYVVPG